MSNLLTPDVLGAVSSLTNYNSNLDKIENSLGASGYYVVSGLVPSAGTGLSVNVTAGTALIAGLVTISAGFAIGGLTPSTTNHLFVKQDGTGTSNTSGTLPALSTKIGTATTNGTGVTSINVLRSSGRQSLIRPENQVAGDPGSMGSIDLSDWNSTAANGFQVFGTLPAGALGGTSASIFFKDSSASVVPGSDADVILTAPQYNAPILSLSTGSWTAAHNVIVPNAVNVWLFSNSSSFIATVKTAAGAGIAVAPGASAVLRCNSTDVKRVTDDSPAALGGDVTGTVGANTVTKIRNRSITQPGATEDTWVPRYNHGGTSIAWGKASSIATLGVWGTTDISALTTGDVEQPNAWTVGSTNHGVQIPDTGTLEWLSILLPSDIGAAGNNLTVTVYRNGVATALAATLNGGAGTETKVLAGTTVSVSQADIITVQAKRVGTPNAVVATYTVFWSCKI